jgi:hypothetical protein
MGTGTQASPEPKLIFPWEQEGMYKPHGKKVIYYPNYPDLVAGRTVHAEVKDNAEADSLAQALNRQARDMCRELQNNPKVTAEQLQSEFANLQKQIDAKADAYISSAKKATEDFYVLIPLLDRMQAMLSQRGKLRELMDTAKLPTWTEWFEDFRPKLKEKMTIRTIQRKLREYRGDVEEEPAKRTIHPDRAFVEWVGGVAGPASGLAQCVLENQKPNPAPGYRLDSWKSVAEHVAKSAMPLFKEAQRRQREYGVRLVAGELLIVGDKRYRVLRDLKGEGIVRSKKSGEYRITLTVREVECKKAPSARTPTRTAKAS